MKIKLKIYSYLPCETEIFEVNGIKSDKDWFVVNYDNGDGEEIEYGCNNRVTDILDINEVRKNLPKDLSLSDDDIKEIQNLLVEKLVYGGCGLCD